METNIDLLKKQLREMKIYIEDSEIINPAVSKASVGWHLAHNLKVLNNVLDAVQNSDPKDHRSSFNLKKTLVFLTRRIPRGKARAPKVVLPHEIITREALISQLDRAEAKLREFPRLHEKSNFNHPFFDNLNKKETKKFLEIHNRHHIKIIKDILTVRNK